MPIAHRFEPEEIVAPLAAALARSRPGDGPVEVTDLALSHAAGMSNETVFFTARWAGGEQEELVARIPAPAGHGLFLGADILQEHALMAALAAEGSLPVPAPRFVERDTSGLGVPFMVMPRIGGRAVDDDPPYTAAGWLIEATAAERAAVNDAAIRALVALHAVDASAPEIVAALPQDGSFGGRLAHAEAWLDWGMQGAPHPVVEAAIAWLRERAPEEPDTVVTWGDARISNMLFDEDHQVQAILDWELAGRGAPETDLGWWLFAYRHHTEGIGVPAPEGFPEAAALVARYEELSGRRCRDIDVYEVLGGVQAALIMVRVARQMIAAGMLPEDSPMALVNPATVLLAQLIGAPQLSGQATSFIGNRG